MVFLQEKSKNFVNNNIRLVPVEYSNGNIQNIRNTQKF